MGSPGESGVHVEPEVLDAVGPGHLDGAYFKRPRPLAFTREYYRGALGSVNGNSPVIGPPNIRVELALELNCRITRVRL